MWEYEHSVETTASPATVWRHWSDMAAWPTWNAGIAALEIRGPFEVGTTITMTAPGDDDPVTMQLVDIVPGELFTDVMDGGDFIVRTVHRLEPTAAGTRIIYRTEITGPAADTAGPELGPVITADFPDVLAALSKVASGDQP
jgi:uncharacterized protein YndB with AHSA1/START domain